MRLRLIRGEEEGQAKLSRGSKSRNKVSVGEPAEGSVILLETTSRYGGRTRIVVKTEPPEISFGVEPSFDRRLSINEVNSSQLSRSSLL